MRIKKKAYFYNKLENQQFTEYPDGCSEWYFEYFGEDARVLDIDGNEVTASKETFYIVPPNRQMYFDYDVKQFTHTACIFDANENFMSIMDIPYMTPIEISNKVEFEQLLFMMESKQISESDLSQAEQDLYLMLIIMFIHDEVHNVQKRYRFNKSDELQNVHNTMMTSLAIPWTVEKLAKSANMSVSTFQRQYLKVYGKTPIADLWDRRFKKAKMLLETGYSIPWILNSCCFKSHQHFSKFFKDRAGVSPSEYLKNIKQP